ncbi:hypothetical protein BpHYR1_050943 [Brachionus plicatilis]|uniref:Uncharacterized protein n=1 Tax=Brachionus plicatilis TaxID=10195 RepID=A0A3M7QTT7_BRAPC|nr:hypothetical protein BpHYR1_050943 [Brachionus plicatilis]
MKYTIERFRQEWIFLIFSSKFDSEIKIRINLNLRQFQLVTIFKKNIIIRNQNYRMFYLKFCQHEFGSPMLN